MGPSAKRPLEHLGISEAEERVYRWLVKHRGATTSEAAHALSFSPKKSQRLLADLEAKGLATHTPERSRKYIPASPDMALSALILQRQRDLQDASLVMQEIQEEANSGQGDSREHIVELITNHDSEKQILSQINNTARDEVITLTRSPLRVDRLDTPIEMYHHEQRAAQGRGVTYRNIVDVELLEVAGAVERLREDIKSGENIRVASNLPLKLVAADRRIAFVPLNLGETRGPSLLVRPSALLDALYVTFDLLWKAASPISFAGANKLDFDSSVTQLNKQAADLVSLMASGLNDKKISSELGVTTRTLRRRLTGLMQELDARTRFQLGWLAALRLSAKDDTDSSHAGR